MIKIKLQAFIAGLMVLMISFSSSAQIKQTKPAAISSILDFQTGGIKMIPVNTSKGSFKVWTKRIGNNPKIKVLLLHGGPGATHEYFECFESFFPKEGIEFIYYDQLGSVYSDKPSDKSLWDIDRFVDEVEQVRIALGLNRDNFFLFGHSWGGFLALEYALKYQSNLKGLIISDALSSAPAYQKYADSVLANQIDSAVLAEIKSIEKVGDFQNPRYMELLMPNFYNKFICRLPINNWPEPLNRAFGHLNHDVYVTMQGPSEFGLTGKLQNWDVSKQLHNIKVPSIFIAGKYDTMDPNYMRWMSSEVTNGSFLLCPNGSHMSMYDDQQVYMSGLIKFIKAVNTANKF